MNYASLVEVMKDMPQGGPMYTQLVQVGSNYATQIARLESARHTEDPRLEQFELEVEGRYNELRELVDGINTSLRAHNPTSPLLPTSKAELGMLVSELLEEIRTRRTGV